MGLWSSHVPSLEKRPFKSFAHFKIGLLVFLLLSGKSPFDLTRYVVGRDTVSHSVDPKAFKTALSPGSSVHLWGHAGEAWAPLGSPGDVTLSHSFTSHLFTSRPVCPTCSRLRHPWLSRHPHVDGQQT